MAMQVIHRDISPYEKSAYLLVGIVFKKAFSPIFQTKLSSTSFFTMRYDCIYSSQVYSGSP